MSQPSKIILKEVPFNRTEPLLSIPMEISGDNFKPTRFFKIQQLIEDSFGTKYIDIPIIGMEQNEPPKN